MCIIYVPSHAENEPDVEAALEALGCEVKKAGRPPEGWGNCDCCEAETDGRKLQERYTADLLALLEGGKTRLVLSLCYYPALSAICERVGIKYAVWICVPYDPGLYSCTLLNRCNYVFLSDYSMYEEFVGGDIRAYYLPLAADKDRIYRILTQESILEDNFARGEVVTSDLSRGQDIPQADLSMMQDIMPRSRMTYHPLSLESPLKDAAKGYLEGCIACRYQIRGLPSMSESLPPWVWEELTAGFHADIRTDSVETAAHYYDCHFFEPLVTYADRDIHLGVMSESPYFEKVCQYSNFSGYMAESIQCFDHFDRLRHAPLVAKRSKINLVIAHRNLQSGIPQIAWDIMAAGGFLLSNFQKDYFRLFPEQLPILYDNVQDMMSKGIYYLHHDSEREKIVTALAEYVCENHTYRERVVRLLETVS